MDMPIDVKFCTTCGRPRSRPNDVALLFVPGLAILSASAVAFIFWGWDHSIDVWIFAIIGILMVTAGARPAYKAIRSRGPSRFSDRRGGLGGT